MIKINKLCLRNLDNYCHLALIILFDIDNLFAQFNGF